MSYCIPRGVAALVSTLAMVVCAHLAVVNAGCVTDDSVAPNDPQNWVCEAANTSGYDIPGHNTDGTKDCETCLKRGCIISVTAQPAQGKFECLASRQISKPAKAAALFLFRREMGDEGTPSAGETKEIKKTCKEVLNFITWERYKWDVYRGPGMSFGEPMPTGAQSLKATIFTRKENLDALTACEEAVRSADAATRQAEVALRSLLMSDDGRHIAASAADATREAAQVLEGLKTLHERCPGPALVPVVNDLVDFLRLRRGKALYELYKALLPVDPSDPDGAVGIVRAFRKSREPKPEPKPEPRPEAPKPQRRHAPGPESPPPTYAAVVDPYSFLFACADLDWARMKNPGVTATDTTGLNTLVLKAYKKAMLHFHTDRIASQPESQQAFYLEVSKKINVARDLVKDSDSGSLASYNACIRNGRMGIEQCQLTHLNTTFDNCPNELYLAAGH